MVNQGGGFNFFHDIHVRIDVRIKNLHFCTTYYH